MEMETGDGLARERTVRQFDGPEPAFWVSRQNILIFDIYLAAIGLTPGGSSTAHIYTQTVHRIQRTEHT